MTCEHGVRGRLTGGTPVFPTVAPLSIHCRSSRYALAVGSSTGPPVCLMSVVTSVLVPSQSWTVSW